jgi:hypothetical protein
MGEARMLIGRRRVMRGVVAGAAILCGRVRGEEVLEKVSRAEAEYQDTPKGIYTCRMCTLFVPPANCKVIDGEVSADGWCNLFDMID